MGGDPVRRRYSGLAIALHWAIALLLAFQISLGWRLEDLPKGPIGFAAFQFHKSVGIAILLLTVVRVGVRLLARRPAPVKAAPALRLLAGLVHIGLYAVMLLGPITGWILVSTAKVRMQTMLFSTVPWPNLPVGPAWHEPAELLHGALAWLGVGLFVLHVGGALHHHMLRDDVVGRMIPARTWKGLTAGLLIGLVGIGGALVWAKAMHFGAAPLVTQPAVAASEQAPVEQASELAEAAIAQPSAEASEQPGEEGAVPWTVEKGGKLGFSVDYSGSPVNGSFAKWNAAIRFSPDDLPNSSIKATIDLASVGTGDSERDDMLRGDSFFAVAAHPKATFTANGFKPAGPGRYTASGTLSLNGKARPVRLDFTLALSGDTARAKGTASLKRTAFDVGTGEFASTDALADAVSVNFAFSARRQP
ncbi:YceI family protein [Novosphingobium cyanobacteriorum]|uniref:YceI family protein n=1 Tax=Novosphingobium cyanobacteriorum TaxID=3024215 RepID=A0ABT6CJ72_9SPHN|nr:YceI family protein [Novosphingobium cyanobacteriorum]MDF8333856.1 YceI family protein [Novosphingobium cyanobacteriorum]